MLVLLKQYAIYNNQCKFLEFTFHWFLQKKQKKNPLISVGPRFVTTHNNVRFARKRPIQYHLKSVGLKG